MRRGRHYAEFTLRSGNAHLNAFVGVVGEIFSGDPTFGGDSSSSSDDEELEGDETPPLETPPADAHRSQVAWLLWTSTGKLRHCGRDSRWVGQPENGALKQGDVVVSAPSRRV